MKTILFATAAALTAATSAFAGSLTQDNFDFSAYTEYGVESQQITIGADASYDVNALTVWSGIEFDRTPDQELSFDNLSVGADYAILPQVDAYVGFSFVDNATAANGFGLEYQDTTVGIRYEW